MAFTAKTMIRVCLLLLATRVAAGEILLDHSHGNVRSGQRGEDYEHITPRSVPRQLMPKSDKPSKSSKAPTVGSSKSTKAPTVGSSKSTKAPKSSSGDGGGGDEEEEEEENSTIACVETNCPAFLTTGTFDSVPDIQACFNLCDAELPNSFAAFSEPDFDTPFGDTNCFCFPNDIVSEFCQACPDGVELGFNTIHSAGFECNSFEEGFC